ncbi:MAG: VOC family protein [Amphiplicatus sp.]
MVLSLQHFALGVPDLKAGADFYTTFGLNMLASDNVLAFRCDNRPHDEVVLIETGKSRKFHHISFGTDAAGMARLEKNISRARRGNASSAI